MATTCDDLRKFVGGQVRIKRFRPRRDLIGKLVYVGRFWQLPGGRRLSLLRFAWMVRLDHESGEWHRIGRRHYLLAVSGYDSRWMDGDLIMSPCSQRGQLVFASSRRAFLDYRAKQLIELPESKALLEDESAA